MLLALIGSLLTHYVFGGLRLQTPGQKLTARRPGAARRCCSALFVALKAVAYWLDRYGLVYSDRGERVHRRQLHRRQRAAGAQDDPGLRRGDLRRRVLRQHRRPQLPAAGRGPGAAAGLQPGHRGGLPGDRAAVRRQAPAPTRRRRPTSSAPSRRRGGVRPSTRSTTSTTPSSSTGTQVDPQAALTDLRNDTETIPNARLLDPNVLSDDVHRAPADPQRLRLPGEARHRPVHDRRQDPRLRRRRARAQQRRPVGQPEQLDQPAHRLHARQRLRRRPGQRGGGRTGRAASRTSPPATCRTTGNIPVTQPRIYYGELISDGDSTRSSARRRARARASSTSPRTGRPGADQQHLRRQGRGVDRQPLPPADVRHLLPASATSCSPARSTTTRRFSTSVTRWTGWRRRRRS